MASEWMSPPTYPTPTPRLLLMAAIFDRESGGVGSSLCTASGEQTNKQVCVNLDANRI